MSVCNTFPHFAGDSKHGSDQHQHHPYPLHGWRAGRQFRTSRNSHGDGAGGVLLVAAVPSLRSREIRYGLTAIGSCYR